MITLMLLLLGLGMMLTAGVAAQRMRRTQVAAQAVLDTRLSAIRPSLDQPEVSELRWLAWIEARVPAFLERDLARADVTISARLVSSLGAVLLLALLIGFVWAGVIGLLLALAGGIVLPLMWLRHLANRRIARFVDLLPHYLDSIRQLLMVGNSFQQALTRATQDSGEGVRRYLDPAVRRIANGASLTEALDAVANRIDLTELHMVVAAVRTNQRSGGSVVPMLQALTALLRDRARVMRELKAASAETRLSATVLCALPPIALLLISAINYDYMRYLWETDGGQRLLLIGLGFQTVGVLVMRRLMRLQF